MVFGFFQYASRNHGGTLANETLLTSHIRALCWFADQFVS